MSDNVDDISTDRFVKRHRSGILHEQSKLIDFADDLNPFVESCSPSAEEAGRNELVDWVLCVHDKLKLSRETLWHCISVIDTYLISEEVEPESLHLVGAACLLKSSRVFEKEPINIRLCVYLMRNCYTQQNIIEMEEYITNLISYRREVYSGDEGLFYLRENIAVMCQSLPASASAGLRERLKHLAYYYAERNLVDGYASLQKCPVLFAAGVVFAARAALETASTSAYDTSPVHELKKAVDDTPDTILKENSRNGAIPTGSTKDPPYSMLTFLPPEPCELYLPPPVTSPQTPRPALCPSSLWPPSIASHSDLPALTVSKMALVVSRVMSKDVLISRFPCAYAGTYPQLYVAARNKYSQSLHGRVAELPYCGSMGSVIDENCGCDACREASVSELH